MNDFDDLETMLVDNYAQVRNYLKLKVDADSVEDLTQTIMLRALSAMRRGHGATEHATGWLWRIVTNCIIDHWRETKRVQLLDIESIAEHAADHRPLPEQMEVRETAERVHRALARLPETQATVAMARMEGCPTEEIAQMMGKSVGAVKALQVRAYAGLHSELGEEYGYGPTRQVIQRTQAPHIAAVLQERGPLPVLAIARALRLNKNLVYSAIYLHPDQFVCVGTEATKGNTTYIWGLTGVHDKVTA